MTEGNYTSAIEIANLIIKGKTLEEIQKKLGISEQSIYKQLNWLNMSRLGKGIKPNQRLVMNARTKLRSDI